MNLRTFPDRDSWYQAIREVFLHTASLAESRVSDRMAHLSGTGSIDICLAGGSTPLAVYADLSTDPELAGAFRGIRVRLWPGDERVVPADDPARNGMSIARAWENCVWSPRPELLLWPEIDPAEEAGNKPGDRAHSGRSRDKVGPREVDPVRRIDAACESYASLLREKLGVDPVFDLVLLGLGADGHTASLFPGEPVLDEKFRLAAPSLSPLAPHRRMTLTYRALSASPSTRRVFLVRGRDKAAILDRLLGGEVSLPASRLAAGAEILFCKED